MTTHGSNAPIPNHITVAETGRELCINRDLLDWTLGYRAVWCVVLSAVIVAMLAAIYIVGMEGKLSEILHPKYLAFSAAALFLLVIILAWMYEIVRRLLNTSTIRLSQGELTYFQGPLPPSGASQVAVDGVRQIDYAEVFHHGQPPSLVFTYRLEVTLENGTRVEIDSELPDVEHASYIANRLAQKMHLSSEPRLIRNEVAGQVQFRNTNRN